MAIRKLTASEYEKAAKLTGLTLPIEQTSLWLDFDSQLPGRKPLGLFAYQPEKASQPVALFAMTMYAQPRYKMIWIKHGPVWTKSPTSAMVLSFIKDFKQYIATNFAEVTFVRLNLPKGRHKYTRASLHRVMYDQTVIIDLSKSDEERLADMTRNGRRDLRKAWKASLITKELTEVNSTNFTPIYAILEETASRDNFGIHTKNLYITMLSALKEKARLYIVYQKNKPLAWALVTISDGGAVYYYGASSQEARRLNASYQLQWDIMQKLKSEGIQTYDFMGIASSGHQHLKNVSVFKEKFSHSTVEISPSYDIVFQPARYKLLSVLRKTRQKIRFYST